MEFVLMSNDNHWDMEEQCKKKKKYLSTYLPTYIWEIAQGYIKWKVNKWNGSPTVLTVCQALF